MSQVKAASTKSVNTMMDTAAAYTYLLQDLIGLNPENEISETLSWEMIAINDLIVVVHNIK